MSSKDSRTIRSSAVPLLGPRGTNGKLRIWNAKVRPVLRIVGWSFPDQHVRRSPLDTYQLSPDPDLPTVGLLHADVDAANSEYCPSSVVGIAGTPILVVGARTQPQATGMAVQVGAYVLNPGSPKALAPDERGPHGPWLIELDGARSVVCRQLPMSLVRYEQCDVDLAGPPPRRISDACVQRCHVECPRRCDQHGQPPELLSLRLNLKGATPLCGRSIPWPENLNNLDCEPLPA